MDFQTDARNDVDKIIKETGLTQRDISLRAGYEEQTLTQMFSKRNVSGRMMKSIRQEFHDVLNKSTMEDSKSKVVVAEQAVPPQVVTPTDKFSASFEGLLALSQSYAASHQVLVDAHKKAIDQNTELMEILKKKESTAVPASLLLEDIESKFRAMEASIVGIGVKVGMYKSIQDGYDNMNKRFYADREGKKPMGTPDGADKIHK